MRAGVNRVARFLLCGYGLKNGYALLAHFKGGRFNFLVWDVFLYYPTSKRSICESLLNLWVYKMWLNHTFPELFCCFLYTLNCLYELVLFNCLALYRGE